ncbi:hypothetical protein CLOM_g13063 [Closterium sp. NIES-68]|nr:hypothetical protein CLOM_g13063 [Closterium sp. NIES-68]
MGCCISRTARLGPESATNNGATKNGAANTGAAVPSQQQGKEQQALGALATADAAAAAAAAGAPAVPPTPAAAPAGPPAVAAATAAAPSGPSNTATVSPSNPPPLPFSLPMVLLDDPVEEAIARMKAEEHTPDPAALLLQQPQLRDVAPGMGGLLGLPSFRALGGEGERGRREVERAGEESGEVLAEMEGGRTRTALGGGGAGAVDRGIGGEEGEAAIVDKSEERLVVEISQKPTQVEGQYLEQRSLSTWSNSTHPHPDPSRADQGDLEERTSLQRDALQCDEVECDSKESDSALEGGKEDGQHGQAMHLEHPLQHYSEDERDKRHGYHEGDDDDGVDMEALEELLQLCVDDGDGDADADADGDGRNGGGAAGAGDSGASLRGQEQGEERRDSKGAPFDVPQNEPLTEHPNEPSNEPPNEPQNELWNAPLNAPLNMHKSAAYGTLQRDESAGQDSDDSIQAASLAAERSLAAVAGIAAECLESELSRFEVICPPGGEDLVVVYVTSLEAVRRTHADCVKMRALLKSLHLRFQERDVALHPAYQDELLLLFAGDMPRVPQLFVRGRHVGGAEDVLQLYEEGALDALVVWLKAAGGGTAVAASGRRGLSGSGSLASAAATAGSGGGAAAAGVCRSCWDVRFVLCYHCHGSRKVATGGGVTSSGGGGQFVECDVCNENGLVICPICNGEAR